MLLTLVVGAALIFLLLTLMFEGTDRWSNLPSHIDSPDEWEGKDDSQHWYTDWRRYVKSWFAHSWKERHWYGKLRKNPITLIALFGPGESRWENDIIALRSVNKPIFFYNPGSRGFYLSRVQYWCDWHFMVQWPFFVGFHLKYGKKGFLNAYFGMKRDTDVYWFPAIYLGNKHK